MCASAGVTCEIRPRDPDIKVNTRSISDARFQDGNLHIIDDRSLVAEGVLNAGAAYLWEFWHLDPVGTKAFSSIGSKDYDPKALSVARAERFFDNLTKRYRNRRRSKYTQPTEMKVIPTGAVSVFFQGACPLNAGATRISDVQMLQAVQDQAGDRPIVVKAHPLASSDPDIRTLCERASKDARLHVTDANVHDILRSSVATVSINSSVAMEGFMHKVPAILFGKSDFHHFAQTVDTPENFGTAHEAAVIPKTGYEHYLAWYFLVNCVPINSGRLHDKLWDRFSDAGFPKDVFL